VFALILALTHHLNEYRTLLNQGAWSESPQFCLLDFPIRELNGKTIGIVGLGSLGQGVANAAQAFGMTVVAAELPYQATQPQNNGDALADIRRLPFPELLNVADIISLHCPLNDETRHLIDTQALRSMRSDALLINTARGGLVNSQALVDALRDGRIGGAGIDVLEQEPLVDRDPLIETRLDNLIITPHIAWAARESRQRALNEMLANIVAFESGEARNHVC
jgi:glycerate dehydrogenase